MTGKCGDDNMQVVDYRLFELRGQYTSIIIVQRIGVTSVIGKLA